MEDVSYKENVYSAREDVAEALYSYRKPDYPVDKCNVVRVAAYDREQNLISEATGVYFIGFQDKSGYDGLMRVSIVTEPDSLFDEETGIYVSENYLQRGEGWERRAFIEVFTEDGKALLSTAAGIRMHGGVTRTYPQKSFNVYAREEYGGSNRFAYDLFENGIGPHKFTLSCGGNDTDLKVKDYIVQTVAVEAELNFVAARMYPCVLFLNGEYWGVYYIAESYDESNIEENFGIDKDNAIVIKRVRGEDTIENGTEEDWKYYYEMMEFITSHDMNDSGNFEKACGMLDIDSFVDYYATELYIVNDDWPWNNVALWRVRNKNTANRYADGRWRYILFDTNSPSVFKDPSFSDIVRIIVEDELFASLIKNRSVWDKFWERVAYLGDEVFNVENTGRILDQWYETMKEPLGKSNERFYGGGVDTTADMEKEIESIKSFLRERPDWMQGFKNYYIEHGGVFWEDGSLLLQ